MSATLTKLRQILGVLGGDVGGGGLGSEHRISWGQVCRLLEPQEALHCRGWYVSGKALKILGTSPLLAHALSNAWDRPNLGTGLAREHDDEHFSFILLAKTIGHQKMRI